MLEIRFYCDESGNTGSNFLDPQQPVYVAGAFALPASKVKAARATVKKHIKESGRDELKGAALMRSPPGRKNAADLIQEMVSVGGLPFFVVIEKGYGLGAWFVNVFLDTDKAGDVRLEYNLDRAKMQQAAMDVARLPANQLQAILTAIRDPSRDNQQKAIEAVAAGLRTTGNNALAEDVEKAPIPAPMLEPEGTEEDRYFRGGMTPNVNAFLTLLANFEKFARHVGATAAQIIHDETASFEDQFIQHMTRVTDKDSYERMRYWLEAHGYPRLDLIQHAKFVESPTEPLVQAADVLGAAVVYLMKQAMSDSTPDRYDFEVMQAIFSVAHMQDDNLRPFTWWVTPDAVDQKMAKYFTAVRAAGKTPSPESLGR